MKQTVYYLLTIATALSAVATYRLVCLNMLLAAVLVATITMVLNEWRNER